MKKIAFLITLLFAMTVNAQTPKYLDPTAPVEERVSDALSRMTTHEKIRIIHAQSKFTSAGVPRLGIRQLNMDDGPHGVREELEWNTWSPARWTNDYVVAFPSLTCLAATWNRQLAAAYGNAVSEEFAFRGKDLMLGPGINIQRTPLNGRAFEYMGEDPCLAGEMVVPYIRSAQANGVGCCLKHFVLNDQETDRFRVNVNVSERAMREIYLLPFEKAVKEAGVWTIMGSYNLWKNVHCCHNDELLNGILKKEWGFKGALVSDWGGTTNTQEAALGGLDIEMGTYTDGKLKESEFTYDDYYLGKPFEKLIEEGKIPMSVLDEKAGRVLRTIFLTAMNPKKVIGSQCSESHYDVCRQIGEEGIVLLKNGKLTSTRKGGEELLPLTKEKLTRLSSLHGKAAGELHVLVVGENATRSLTMGGGSSELKTLYDVSPLEALTSQLSLLSSHLTIDHAQGYESGRPIYDHVDKVDPAKNEQLREEALAKAKDADLIIFIGGMNKNHRQDCENGDRESYALSFGQNELISGLAAVASPSKGKKKPLIVITFGGNPYAMPWLEKADALLHCWYLGSESGHALVNVLTGKANPSGRLPVTFAKKYEDYPYVRFGAEAYPGVNRQVFYREDVFVGYRGFEKNATKALFPFGFGLSYTTFKYGKPALVKDGDGWLLTVDVTNTGGCEGKEVVQLYIGDEKASVERPVKELRDFVKLSLKAGETKTAQFRIDRKALSFWDEGSHAWKAEPGRFSAHVCASAEDVRGTVYFDL